jgi:hypothetical protein
MSIRDDQKFLNYLLIALKSALAAGLCLGLPAGLLLWLILAREAGYSVFVDPVIGILRVNGLRSIFVVVIGSLIWSCLLGRISGYRPWWRIAVASTLGILTAWFSPLANVDGILYEYRPGLPIHLNYAASMVGLIGGVTLFVGMAYGVVLRSAKAALTLGLTTSFVSIFVSLLIIFAFDRLGIRVGTGNLAMPKVTVVDLIMSAIMGGAILGVGFSWFVGRSKVK